MHRCLGFLLLALVPACSDAVVDSEPTTPASCSVALEPPAAGLAQGVAATIALTTSGPVELGSAMSTTVEARLDGAALVVRTGYSPGASTADVTIDFTCDGTPQQERLEVPVRAVTWRSLPGWEAGVTGPINREYGSMWVDRSDPNRLLAFGGFHYEPQQFTPANELWAFDLEGETWMQLAPTDAPFVPGAGLALVGSGEAFLFGGLDGSDTNYALHRLDYAASAPVFTDLTPSSPGGPGDYQPAVVWDEARARLLAVCGANNAWGWHCDVRIIDTTTGEATVVDVDGEPPAGRNGMFWVHDEATERLIIFSGDNGGSPPFQSDTWALELGEEPMRWVQLDLPNPPIGRRNGAYALDPVGHRMLIWGGTPDGATAAPGVYALHLDRGEEAWHEVLPDGAPPPDRASGAAAYDEARQRVVMGFGNSSLGNFTDLWELAL